MKHELTQELYSKVMALNPSQFSSCGSDCPVENISWMQAVTFANKLSRFQALEECYIIDGYNVSWDKGVECLGWRLPLKQNGNMLRVVQKDSLKVDLPRIKINLPNNVVTGTYGYTQVGTHQVSLHGLEVLIQTIQTIWDVKLERDKGALNPVCSKVPNDFDLCDMSGNVWEWVWDGYGAYPKTKKLVKDPMAYTTKSAEIIRGGVGYPRRTNSEPVTACMRVALSLTQWYQTMVLLAHDLFAPRQR